MTIDAQDGSVHPHVLKQRLKRTPRAGRVVPEFGLDEMREIIVPPFRMVYRIRRAEIRVVAVVHVRRDPGRVVSRRRG